MTTTEFWGGRGEGVEFPNILENKKKKKKRL